MALSGSALLRLGSVTFTEDETPDEFLIEQTQSVAIHDNVGGKRSIQTLGTIWRPISWDGLLRGATAPNRARELQRMCAEGAQQRLSWRGLAFDVVLAGVKVTHRSAIRIDYQIQVDIVREVSGATTIAAPSSLDQKISSASKNADTHLSTVEGLDEYEQTHPLRDSLTTTNTALDKAGPAAAATGPTYVSAAQQLNDAVTKADLYLKKLPPGVAPRLRIAANRYLHQIKLMKKNFDRGQAPKTISLVGGTLYDVSAQEYGDPAFANSLRSANGLTSPYLPTGDITTLVLPPLR